jgi:transposase
MNETLTINSERVDDIPLLLAHLKRMGVAELLDEHFPAHGNWQGLSLGELCTVWLTHILSEADHRLSHVQPWAEKRLETLRQSIGQGVRALDFSDDRLAGVLSALSDDERWGKFENALNQHLLRVYDLQPQRVRLDSTTASGYWSVTCDGLFQFGHSKEGRSDQPQVKVMLAALDPLGMPLATQVLAGQRADDPLYVPAIKQVRQGLGRRGLLYVGDCKMGALQTRAFTAAGGDFYLCPLAQQQLPLEQMESYLSVVWTGQQPLTPIYRRGENGAEEQVAEGYERDETVMAVVEGESIEWQERRLVVRSLQQARREEEKLRTRLQKAQAELMALNEWKQGKKRFREVEALRQAGEAIVKRHAVDGLLQLSCTETVTERAVRPYGERAATARVEKEVHLRVLLDEAALAKAIRSLGWRVYVTNQPAEQLSLAQAVLAYRSEYLIEHGFGRLKGKPLSLTPMYLRVNSTRQQDERATGLIRLLSVGLRVLTLLELTVRRNLAAEGGKLAGLYAGNAKRTTAQPTAERLLEAFKYITLTTVEEPHQIRRHLTPLSALQQRILTLLSFPLDIYTSLCANSLKPPGK